MLFIAHLPQLCMSIRLNFFAYVSQPLCYYHISTLCLKFSLLVSASSHFAMNEQRNMVMNLWPLWALWSAIASFESSWSKIKLSSVVENVSVCQSQYTPGY